MSHHVTLHLMEKDKGKERGTVVSSSERNAKGNALSVDLSIDLPGVAG